MIAFATGLDQPNSPLGMGVTFILITMGFVLLFVVMVLVGTMRNRNKAPQEPITMPVLRRKDAERAQRRKDLGLD